MTTITRQLRTDHVNIGKLLFVLENQLSLLEESRPVDYSLMMDMFAYITEYPDVYHHPKEDLLFDRWLQREPTALELVKQIREEHQSIASDGLHFLNLLRAAATDVMLPRSELISAGRRYIDNQRAHIRKEEKEIFPKAAAGLTEEDWRNIDQRLVAPEDPLFGEKVSQAFRNCCDKICQLVDEQEAR